MLLPGIRIELVACHRKPERSFFWKGRQFPVCARCTGFYLGYLVYPLFLFDIVYFNLSITLALLFPAIIDGLWQAFFHRESNNTLRLITGFFSGVGLMSLASIIGERVYAGILFFVNFF